MVVLVCYTSGNMLPLNMRWWQLLCGFNCWFPYIYLNIVYFSFSLCCNKKQRPAVFELATQPKERTKEVLH